MSNNRKITLLRQVTKGFCSSLGEVRGVAKIESSQEKTLAKISFLNLAPLKSGEYQLFFQGDKDWLKVLKKVDGEEFILSGKVSAITLLFIDENGVLPVCHGAFCDWKEIGECVADAKKYLKIEDQSSAESGLFSKAEEGEIYDDEAVATVNYYEFKEGREDEDLKNGSVYGERDTAIGDEEEKSRKSSQTETYDDAKNDDKEDYYQKIKSQLQKIFDENPTEKNLAEMVSESRWVKVTQNGKSFVVGVIDEKNYPKYLCYGLPGAYGQKPKEIKGYASFIPKSPFALKGDGYWVMYQDAVSGKSIE